MASKVATSPTDEAVEFVSSFQERRDRYPEDTYLRRHGFKIHRRPKGPRHLSTWTRHGKVYGFRDALRVADAEAGEVRITTSGGPA